MSEVYEPREVYRDLFRVVTPIAFQNLMSSLVPASDAFMLGLLDQSSLSASSLAGQIAFVCGLFFNSFTAGCNVIAAQYWGKGDRGTVEKVLALTMRYCLLVGMIFSLAALCCPALLMRIYTPDPVLIEAGARYLRTVALSYALTGISQTYFGVMKICDRAALSSLIGSLAVVLNIVLNGCLIFGVGIFPKMGITGAALATVIARAFEVLCVTIAAAGGKCVPLRFKWMLCGRFPELHHEYWRYTCPCLFNQLGWGGGISMYSVIMGHLGNDATSANSMASIVRSIIASFCWGIASGVGILIGGMLGRGELKKARKAGGSFVRFSIATGVVSGLVIVALTPFLVQLLSSKLSVQAQYYLKYMLLMAAYYIIGNALNSTVIAGIFPAGGDTRFGMICDIVTLWGIVVPLGMLAAFVWHWSVLAVAAVLTLDEFVKLPAVYRHYKKYLWLRNITT